MKPYQDHTAPSDSGKAIPHPKAPSPRTKGRAYNVRPLGTPYGEYKGGLVRRGPRPVDKKRTARLAKKFNAMDQGKFGDYSQP